MYIYGYITGRRGSGRANWRAQIRRILIKWIRTSRLSFTNFLCLIKCGIQSETVGHRCSQSVFVHAFSFAWTIVGPCLQHEEALNSSLESDTGEETEDLGEDRFLALCLLLV